MFIFGEVVFKTVQAVAGKKVRLLNYILKTSKVSDNENWVELISVVEFQLSLLYIYFFYRCCYLHMSLVRSLVPFKWSLSELFEKGIFYLYDKVL